MTLVKTNEDMAYILIEREGYVLNERPEVRRVHHASCEAVAAMVASHYPKYFSLDPVASKVWLDERFGHRKWVNCGYCSGLEHRPGTPP
jgi:hypothetical protein